MNNLERNEKIAPYAHSIVKLLKEVIYYEDSKAWSNILDYQIEISQYFDVIGIELIVDKKDGFAFLKQKELDEDGTTIGLTRRTPLSYELTLISVLLREWIEEFEIKDTDSRNLFITHKQIKDRAEFFFKEKSNKVKLLKNIDKYIKDTMELGFLKEIKKDKKFPNDTLYEVKRIIKAKITNDKLEEFKKKLERDAKKD
jgi:hypothetical protein